MEHIPFFIPDLSEEDAAAAAAVLRSGWITTGPVTARFERAVADFCRADRTVCLSSQTAAAELVLRLLGNRTGGTRCCCPPIPIPPPAVWSAMSELSRS